MVKKRIPNKGPRAQTPKVWYSRNVSISLVSVGCVSKPFTFHVFETYFTHIVHISLVLSSFCIFRYVFSGCGKKKGYQIQGHVLRHQRCENKEMLVFHRFQQGIYQNCLHFMCLMYFSNIVHISVFYVHVAFSAMCLADAEQIKKYTS